MSFLGSPQHFVEMLVNYIRARVGGGSSIDNRNTPIDRQRRLVGLILFLTLIGLPAGFLLLWTYFPNSR